MGGTSSFDDAAIRRADADVLAQSVKVRSVALTLCYLARFTCEHSQLLREDRYRGPAKSPVSGEHRGP